MNKNKMIKFSVNSLSKREKESISDFIFNMVKTDDIEKWLVCFIHAAKSIHELTEKHQGDIMYFHLSMFMSVLITSPDCDEKINYINESINLLKTNMPTKKVG